jgi:hypothetical protein
MEAPGLLVGRFSCTAGAVGDVLFMHRRDRAAIAPRRRRAGTMISPCPAIGPDRRIQTMTSLSRITLATILMGSLAMPVLAQTNGPQSTVAPGAAGTPSTVTKSEPQNSAAKPAKNLHKTAGTPSATKKPVIHHVAASQAAPVKTAPAKDATTTGTTKDTGATAGSPRAN